MQEVQETWVQSLSRKDPCRRKWQPLPIFLPGESHGWRSPVAIVHGVPKSPVWLSDCLSTHTCKLVYCQPTTTTHSNICPLIDLPCFSPLYPQLLKQCLINSIWWINIYWMNTCWQCQSANFSSCKKSDTESGHMDSLVTAQPWLGSINRKALINNMQTNNHSCVAVQFYLWKQNMSYIWPLDQSVLTDYWRRLFVVNSGVRVHLDIDSDASVYSKNY